MIIRRPIVLSILVLIIINLILLSYLKHIGKNFDSSTNSLREAYINCLANTKKPKEKGECLRALAEHALKNSSVTNIESTMSSLTDTSQLQWCHEFIHYVGWEIYKRTPNLNEAFALARGTCDSAMYHGIVEQYINTTITSYSPEDFVNIVAPNACTENLSKQRLPEGMKGPCYHGLGHAFMFLTDNDLNQSLKYCDYVLVGYQKSCYTGALMENLHSKQVGRSVSHTNKFSFASNDPNYPCNKLDGKYKEQCYRYKGVYNVMQTNDNIKQSMLECLKVTPEYQEECFWGVGSNIPGPHRSSSNAGDKCNEAFEVSPQSYEQCIMGAMAFIVQLNFGNAKESVKFCDLIKENYKAICYREAGKNFGNWITPKESLREKCQHFSDFTAQHLCLTS